MFTGATDGAPVTELSLEKCQFRSRKCLKRRQVCRSVLFRRNQVESVLILLTFRCRKHGAKKHEDTSDGETDERSKKGHKFWGSNEGWTTVSNKRFSVKLNCRCTKAGCLPGLLQWRNCRLTRNRENYFGSPFRLPAGKPRHVRNAEISSRKRASPNFAA